MSIAMGHYWRHRSIGSEGVERLQQAVRALVTLPDAGPAMNRERASLEAWVLATAAMLSATTSRQTEEARGWADDAVRLARESRDDRALSFALLARALTSMFGSRASFEDVLALSGEMIGLAEAQGAWSMLAGMAAGIAMRAAVANPSGAAAWLKRASDAAHRSGNPWAIAFSALAWGRVLSYGGNVDESRPWFVEALEWSRRLGDQRQELVVRSELAHALRRGGSVSRMPWVSWQPAPSPCSMRCITRFRRWWCSGSPRRASCRRSGSSALSPGWGTSSSTRASAWGACERRVGPVGPINDGRLSLAGTASVSMKPSVDP